MTKLSKLSNISKEEVFEYYDRFVKAAFGEYFKRHFHKSIPSLIPLFTELHRCMREKPSFLLDDVVRNMLMDLLKLEPDAANGCLSRLDILASHIIRVMDEVGGSITGDIKPIVEYLFKNVDVLMLKEKNSKDPRFFIKLDRIIYH